ncbi:hypothetical protein LZK98_08120 [Sphingomonas cannabina]|uniref:hypothetical protein n=1 Tax=Sphingomonas cannabina TaxID=2899123 RepID=UPI001F410238|nr:hypothetical protein [Sphingomonas cannabina]UIJ46894.1 hypothetical protein LZK98_08120 [Sphingomonas cannabina]
MRAALAVLLLLAGCDQAGADGYTFDRKELDRKTVCITQIEHRSLAELRAASPPSTPGRDKLFGWSRLQSGNRCEMHVMDPMITWAPEHRGHEDAHCFHGRYHR